MSEQSVGQPQLDELDETWREAARAHIDASHQMRGVAWRALESRYNLRVELAAAQDRERMLVKAVRLAATRISILVDRMRACTEEEAQEHRLSIDEGETWLSDMEEFLRAVGALEEPHAK